MPASYDAILLRILADCQPIRAASGEAIPGEDRVWSHVFYAAARADLGEGADSLICRAEARRIIATVRVRDSHLYDRPGFDPYVVVRGPRAPKQLTLKLGGTT